MFNLRQEMLQVHIRVDAYNPAGNIGVQNTGASSKVHIGDLVSNVSSDINTTHIFDH